MPLPTPLATYTLSGVVSEVKTQGSVPIEGVRVHWSELHVDAYTNADGFYSLQALAGQSPIFVSKDGYQQVMRMVSLTADTKVNIQITRQ
jgi:hypothetical protein